MNWTAPADLRAQVQRLWERGELLRACVSDEAIAWPLRLTLKAPGTADLTDRFEAVRDWARTLDEVSGPRIEWRDWTHRVQGRQSLPGAVWVDSLEDALAIVGKTRQAERYRTLWQRTAAAQPALLPWLIRRPHQTLELADAWEPLLAVVAWLQAQPRPGVYVRQVDAPGVHSKFIEAHRGVLSEWFDLVLPPEAIDPAATGAAGFARRYGFLDKPIRIRFRLLDPALPSLPGCRGLPDIALDAASFAALALPVTRVFVTENEINFLAFPPVPAAIVVFGTGYGWESLARADWLHRCRLYYWGDLDTHGFVILDRLRGYFPRVLSLLMDRETLHAHRPHWGEEPAPARQDLPRLTPDESALYDELRNDRPRPRLRLEQERVGHGYLVEKMHHIASEAPMLAPVRHDWHDDRPVEDHRVLLRDACWTDYERLLELRGERSVPKLAYLEGCIEIMSPSRTHESIKSVIGCLVEVYCLERGIRFTALGSWTLKDAERQRGLEPDECYIFGDPAVERPHLAIEVEWTAGGLDKLDIYRQLGVAEVWIWRRGRIQPQVLRGAEYVPATRSEQLPALDLALLTRCLDAPTTFDAIQAFRQTLRAAD